MILLLLLQGLRSLFQDKADLVLENLALRQQVAVLKEKRSRPRLSNAHRLFWIILSRFWSKWATVLEIVKPETVVRWHRAGFRAFWRWKSRQKSPGRPPVHSEVRALIRKMAQENPTWGAPRIHGELLMLGFEISERTVSRYMPRRPAPPEVIARWKAFLRNHRDGIAAMDFLTEPTVSFEVLYVFFVIQHGLRAILHFNATAHPTAAWVIQQLRDAFPFDTTPRYLIFDRDSKFAPAVQHVIKSFGIKPVRIAFRSPWQNGVAERWVLSARRELLDHVVVLNERHLRHLLRQYVCYYAEDRTHLTLAKGTPARRSVQPRPTRDAQVVALPRVGGLHHRYEWRLAA